MLASGPVPLTFSPHSPGSTTTGSSIMSLHPSDPGLALTLSRSPSEGATQIPATPSEPPPDPGSDPSAAPSELAPTYCAPAIPATSSAAIERNNAIRARVVIAIVSSVGKGAGGRAALDLLESGLLNGGWTTPARAWFPHARHDAANRT